MAIVTINDTHLTDICNAVRSKTKTTTKYKPSEIAQAVSGIQTGITPSGSLEITENGTYDVTNYASANVNVESSGGGISVDDIATGNITGDITLSSTNITNGAFWGNTKITSITAPNVTTIGQYGLSNCTRIISINMPELETINARGLEYCTKLTTANFPKLTTLGTYGFYYCSALAGKLVFPMLSSVTTQCFYRCDEITSIDLPVCKSIADQTFRYCTKLDTLILRNATLCTLGNVNTFYNTPFASGGSGGKIYVPKALLENYKTASKWATIFGYGTNEFRALEDYTIDGTITGELDESKI